MDQHKSNGVTAKQYQMDETKAGELRRLAAEVSDAVEAHIKGESASGERIRRSTQKVQIAGMGPAEYWGTQLWQASVPFPLPLKSVCLVMAQEMGLLPAINEQNSPITATEVAGKIGSEELLIIRIMRVLTGVGICDETGPNAYRANELSKIAASLHGQAGVKIENELLFPIAAKVVPYMREHGFKQFPRRPKEMDPTQYAFGGKMMWEHFRDSPEHKRWFDTLMVENRAVNIPWFHIYPFADELGQACSNDPHNVLLVDVGGNRGADILEFRQAFPNLPGRLILQELPETIAAVDKASMADIELQAYDFFTPQPVKGAKAYFWRWILHNWDDDSIRTFLSKTVEVMDKDSKILIEEYVLPDIGVDIKCSSHDILMMLYHSGMERSLSQWRALMDSCGLEIVKVWTRPDTDPSILECGLKKE